MSNQLLIQKETSNDKKRIIKTVISANGARYEEQGGKLFDCEGRVVDIEFGEEEYYLIRKHINNILTESTEEWAKVDKILQNGLTDAGIPEGYQVCAYLKESFTKEEAY